MATARQKLHARIDSLRTAQLFDVLDTLEVTHAGRGLNQYEMMVKVAACTAIEDRHDLSDALDELYADDSDFTGTYVDALKRAMRQH